MPASILGKAPGWSKELTWTFMGWVLWQCVFLTLPLQAVHFVAVGDPQHNTTPPQDASEARLWHLQGHWNAFLGTPIADQWFVTAKHVGGSLGDTFHLMGRPYMAVVKIPDPESDLTLWGVSDPFPDVVPIYSGSQEAGRRTLLFGKGPSRGEAVWVEVSGSQTLRGWKWGHQHKVLRWGENRIHHVLQDPGLVDRNLGELIVAFFDQDGLPNEAGLSGGDSGGGMFIKIHQQWYLAGISYSAGGEFKVRESDAPFKAMLFDHRGLYQKGRSTDSGEVWISIPLQDEPQPGQIAGTRMSYRRDWIEQQIKSHADPLDAILLESAEQAEGPYEPVKHWTLVTEPLGLKIDQTQQTQFYRIKAPTPLKLLAPIDMDTYLILPFEG